MDSETAEPHVHSSLASIWTNVWQYSVQFLIFIVIVAYALFGEDRQTLIRKVQLARDADFLARTAVPMLDFPNLNPESAKDPELQFTSMYHDQLVTIRHEAARLRIRQSDYTCGPEGHEDRVLLENWPMPTAIDHLRMIARDARPFALKLWLHGMTASGFIKIGAPRGHLPQPEHP